MDDFWKGIVVLVATLIFLSAVILIPVHKYWSYHEDLKEKGFVFVVEPMREVLVPIGENYVQPSQIRH